MASRVNGVTNGTIGRFGVFQSVEMPNGDHTFWYMWLQKEKNADFTQIARFSKLLDSPNCQTPLSVGESMQQSYNSRHLVLGLRGLYKQPEYSVRKGK
jgi:hypothetical protein